MDRCTARSRRAYPEPVAPEPLTLLDRARGAMDVLVREMLKFGVVGAVAFVVDIGVFNMLRFGFAEGTPAGQPLRAKIISVTLATLTAWLGNRYWTFRHRRQRQAHHELMLFIGFNLAGMAIALARDLAESNGGRLELIQAKPVIFALFLSEAEAAA